MTTHATRPFFFTAVDGTLCLRVPVADKQGEMINLNALKLIQAAAITKARSLACDGQERHNTLGDLVQVTAATITAAAQRSECVYHHKDDSLNLKRATLALVAHTSEKDGIASAFGDADDEPIFSAEISVGVSDVVDGATFPRRVTTPVSPEKLA